jgi:hypothetical protein
MITGKSPHTSNGNESVIMHFLRLCLLTCFTSYDVDPH